MPTAGGDADGYGDMNKRELACEQPEDAVLSGADCDDANSSISPDAVEICDELDNNCNGNIDEGVGDNFLSPCKVYVCIQ